LSKKKIQNLIIFPKDMQRLPKIIRMNKFQMFSFFRKLWFIHHYFFFPNQ